MRKVSQLFFFLLFIYVFLLATYPMQSVIPLNIFFMLSPLTALMSLFSSFKLMVFFIPALCILVTSLLGRYFCGWICPMGFCLDAGRRVITSRREGDIPRKWMYLKYYLLIFILTASLLSLSPGYLLEPVTIVFRTFTMAFFPSFFSLWKNLTLHVPRLLEFPLASSGKMLFNGGLLFFIIFAGLLSLEAITRRFWCRTLCPMGALLGLISRFSLLQKKVSPACIDCGLCRRRCRTGAIHPGNKDFMPSECIYCFECKSICPSRAISFAFEWPKAVVKPFTRWFSGKKRDDGSDYEFTRRGFLLSFGGGIAWALLAGVDYSREMISPRLIRPPGALPEREFVSLCIRCGECMKVCVTNGLQPAFGEAGFSGFWTPRLVPLRGYCEENCNFCSRICPTGAIRPIEVKDKKHIRIGQARIDRSKCIAWDQGKECLVCDEHCSYDAVFWKEVEGKQKPFVDPDNCVGCGICENKCPTGPDPAIVVYALSSEKRKLP